MSSLYYPPRAKNRGSPDHIAPFCFADRELQARQEKLSNPPAEFHPPSSSMLVCATVRADVRPAVDGDQKIRFDQHENRTDLKRSGAAQIRERDRRFESLLLQQ
jgi:hypothetical protein